MSAFYQAIATALDASDRSAKLVDRAGDTAFAHKAMCVEWRDYLEAQVKEHAPSGSGFDSGTYLDYAKSTPAKLVFVTAFHHMNDAGFYVGWSHHTVVVTASLLYGVDIQVTGRDRAGIKQFIAEQFGQLQSTHPQNLATWREAKRTQYRSILDAAYKPLPI